MLNETTRSNFAKLFPEGQLQEITSEEVPSKALNRFEGYSRRFVLPEKYRPLDFKAFFLIKHDNGDLTFVANQSKTYGPDDTTTEDLCYFFDYRNQEEIGHGELCYTDIPFASYLTTEATHSQQGLNTRRLLLMNAFAQMLYQLPLHSDSTPLPEESDSWKHLRKMGKARLLNDNRSVMI